MFAKLRRKRPADRVPGSASNGWQAHPADSAAPQLVHASPQLRSPPIKRPAPPPSAAAPADVRGSAAPPSPAPSDSSPGSAHRTAAPLMVPPRAAGSPRSVLKRVRLPAVESPTASAGAEPLSGGTSSATVYLTPNESLASMFSYVTVDEGSERSFSPLSSNLPLTTPRRVRSPASVGSCALIRSSSSARSAATVSSPPYSGQPAPGGQSPDSSDAGNTLFATPEGSEVFTPNGSTTSGDEGAAEQQIDPANRPSPREPRPCGTPQLVRKLSFDEVRVAAPPMASPRHPETAPARAARDGARDLTKDGVAPVTTVVHSCSVVREDVAAAAAASTPASSAQQPQSSAPSLLGPSPGSCSAQMSLESPLAPLAFHLVAISGCSIPLLPSPSKTEEQGPSSSSGGAGEDGQPAQLPPAGSLVAKEKSSGSVATSSALSTIFSSVEYSDDYEQYGGRAQDPPTAPQSSNPTGMQQQPSHAAPATAAPAVEPFTAPPSQRPMTIEISESAEVRPSPYSPSPRFFGPSSPTVGTSRDDVVSYSPLADSRPKLTGRSISGEFQTDALFFKRPRPEANGDTPAAPTTRTFGLGSSDNRGRPPPDQPPRQWNLDVFASWGTEVEEESLRTPQERPDAAGPTVTACAAPSGNLAPVAAWSTPTEVQCVADLNTQQLASSSSPAGSTPDVSAQRIALPRRAVMADSPAGGNLYLPVAAPASVAPQPTPCSSPASTAAPGSSGAGGEPSFADAVRGAEESSTSDNERHSNASNISISRATDGPGEDSRQSSGQSSPERRTSIWDSALIETDFEARHSADSAASPNSLLESPQAAACCGSDDESEYSPLSSAQPVLNCKLRMLHVNPATPPDTHRAEVTVFDPLPSLAGISLLHPASPMSASSPGAFSSTTGMPSPRSPLSPRQSAHRIEPAAGHVDAANFLSLHTGPSPVPAPTLRGLDFECGGRSSAETGSGCVSPRSICEWPATPLMPLPPPSELASLAWVDAEPHQEPDPQARLRHFFIFLLQTCFIFLL